jgi:hypothetical protein
MRTDPRKFPALARPAVAARTASPAIEKLNHVRGPALGLLVGLMLVGCGGPSDREIKNRRELEALLTAIALKNKKELHKDIKRIEDRHSSGDLSDGSYKSLREIIDKAQAGDWSGAEKQAYELRESTPYFK